MKSKFDMKAYMLNSTKNSGVPLKLKNKAAIKRVAALLS